MIRKLRKIGNSKALILDQWLLELLGLSDDDEVQIVVRLGSLIITAAPPQQIDEVRFEQCLDRVQQDWGDLLERLAQ